MSEQQSTSKNESYPSLDYFAAPAQNNQPIKPAAKAEPNPQAASVAYNPTAYNQTYPAATPMSQPTYQYYGFSTNHPSPSVPPLISPDGYAAPGQPMFAPYGYPAMYAPPVAMLGNVKNSSKANFGQRLVALIIDTCVVYGFVTFFQIAILILAGLLISYSYSLQTWVYFFGQAVLIIGLAAFDTIMLGRKGQTVGCISVNMRFVNANGQRPGYWRAFFRWLLLTISFSLAFAGTIYLIAWTSQQLHPYTYGYSYSAGYTYYGNNSSNGLELLLAVLSLGAVAFFLVGRFWFLWDIEKRTLFDKIVGVYALNTNYYRY